MILFHGTNADFDNASLEFAKERRDFGRGFYTTTIREQAESWAEAICDRRKTKKAFLYEFEFSEEGLKVHSFAGINKEWFDFIIENRIKGGIQHTFDVVIGPVANDKTMDTIATFLAGIIDTEEALKRLRYMKANDQVSLHTEKALSHLKLTRRTEWNV